MKKSIHFAAFLLLPALVFAQTFTENKDLLCGDSIHIDQLGFPTWNMPVIAQGPTQGTATITGDLWYSLIYQSPVDFEGLDTVVVACAHATQITCDTGIYVFHINCQTSTSEASSNTGLKIFPNPACEEVFIQGALSGAIYIADASGSIIARYNSGGKSDLILPVAHLSPGFYLVFFRTGAGIKAERLVINR